jgi:hypothetical protein
LIRYLVVPPITIVLVTEMASTFLWVSGLFALSRLSNVIVTLAFVTPACPRL